MHSTQKILIVGENGFFMRLIPKQIMAVVVKTTTFPSSFPTGGLRGPSGITGYLSQVDFYLKIIFAVC